MSDDNKNPQISFAKTVDLEYPPNKLDNASQNLREQYEKAKAAQLEQQKAQQPKDIEKKSPNMSYAKTVDLEYPQNKLDKSSEDVKNQFAKAQLAKQQTQNNSEMIKKQAPGMHNKPGGNLQKSTDQKDFNNDLAKDDQKSKEHQRAIDLNNALYKKAGYDKQNDLNLNNERNKDNDDRGR